jgi:hypothetical protein
MFFLKRIVGRKREIMPFGLAARSLSITLPLLALLIFSGCQKQTPAADIQASAPGSAAKAPKVSAPPEADILVDEARLAKPYAIIGGTVRNVGPEKLEKLSVEIELRRREDGGLERREVSVEPSDLSPGEQGKYTLKVLSDEWSSSRPVTLRSAAGPREVAFNSLPGAKRPPERPPVTKVIADAPRKKSGPNSSEFINTPDSPIKVP